jgi:GTP-binding protein YchF
MSILNCGIVGLPNVGKSTLANILAKMQVAEAANYPFCTIEPNSFIVSIKDERLEKLAKIANSEKIIYSQLGIHDIAGLVKGASKGEGLGNKFLSHIREVDAIVHVIRCFENSDITHVCDTIDPIRDKEIIEYELIESDLESILGRITRLEKKAKSDKEAKEDLETLLKIQEFLKQGKMASEFQPSSEREEKFVRTAQLLTTKPVIYLCNISDADFENDKYKNNKYYQALLTQVKEEEMIVFPIKFESDFIGVSDEEKEEMMREFGFNVDNIQKLLKKCYETLNLQSFFTVGPKEARSWTIVKGWGAPKAAGVIHNDFEKGFIRAETIAYDDYIQYNGEQGAKNAGKMRTEGKEYVVQNGDVMHFLFNV